MNNYPVLETSPVSPYAHGGHATRRRKHPRMMLVHLNRDELRHLESAQGGRDEDTHTGVPSLKRLGSLLENPHVLELIKRSMHESREHHAHGGHVGFHEPDYSPKYEKIAGLGQHGDTELALITPHTAHVLDSMIGGPSINPHDGRRQYFLGSLINGFKNLVAPIGKAIAPAIGGLFGGAKSAVSNMAQQAMPALKNAATSAFQQATTVNPETGMSPLAAGIQGTAQGLMSGEGFGRSMARGFQSGSQGINNPIGNSINQASSQYLGGQSPYRAAMHGMQAGAEGMDNPMARAASRFAGSQLSGADMRQSLGRGFMAGTEGMDNPMARFGRGAAQAGMSGEGFGGMMQRGAMGALEGRNDPFSQSARAGIEARRGGGSYMDSMRQGGMRGMAAMRGEAYPQEMSRSQMARQQPHDDFFDEQPFGQNAYGDEAFA